MGELGGGQKNDLVCPHGLHLQHVPAPVHVVPHPQVAGPGAHIFRDVQTVPAADHQPHLGGQPPKFLNDRLHLVTQQGLGHVHPEDAGGFPALLADLGQPVGRQQQLPGLGEKALPRLGEDHPPPCPLEQGQPQLLLQLLDMDGDGGLGVAQGLGGPLVAAPVHNRLEGAQIFQLHKCSPCKRKIIDFINSILEKHSLFKCDFFW